MKYFFIHKKKFKKYYYGMFFVIDRSWFCFLQHHKVEMLDFNFFINSRENFELFNLYHHM